MEKIKSEKTLNLILFSGLAGGVMEILWIVFYSFFSPQDAGYVAREVALTLIPAASHWSVAPLIGVVIHMVLSLLLSAGFVIFIWLPFISRYGRFVTLISAVSILSAIWAVNFYALLPAMNPHFVTLLPLAVTLMSKMFFGLAMGTTLVLQRKKIY